MIDRRHTVTLWAHSAAPRPPTGGISIPLLRVAIVGRDGNAGLTGQMNR
jgi:hypothetical protein